MTIDLLTELYNENLFQQAKDSCQIIEPDGGASVTGANLILKGAEFIVCANEIVWKGGENLYAKTSPVHKFEFRRRCDGFVICFYNGQKYLIWIELKSSFNQVFKDAIFQLSGCYVKMKSYLNCFENYHPEEYKELGIVVSQAEQPYQGDEGNDEIYSRRGGLVLVSDSLTDLYRSNYRNTTTPNTFFLRGEDFKIMNTHLSDKISLGTLPVYYYETTGGTPTIDLGSILAIF